MKTLFALLFAAVAFGQPGTVLTVTTIPSGSCIPRDSIRIVQSSGATYSCGSGTWHLISGGGGGGTVTSIATTSPITGGTITATGTIGCATCVVNNATNTFTSSGTLDLSAGAVAALRAPNVAGAAPTTEGTVAYDTTNKNLHIGANSVDNVVGLFPSSALPTNGNCVQASVSSSVVRLADAGSPCGGGGGGTVPTSGWTAINGIVYNDFLTPVSLPTTVLNAGSLNVRALTRTLSGASTYTAIASLRCIFASLNSQNAAIYISDGTKLIGLEVLSQAGNTYQLRVQQWNSVTSIGSTVHGPTADIVTWTPSLKIVKDVTNRTYYYYSAGAWVQFYQEAASTFLTETTIGFGGLSVNAGAIPLQVELIDWSLI